MNRKYIFLLLVIFVFSFYLYLSNKKTQQGFKQAPKIGQGPEVAKDFQGETSTRSLSSTQESALQNISSEDFQKTQLVIPVDKKVKNAVALNPHNTPMSLVSFAADLGRRYHVSLEDREEADKLFSELESCSDNDSEAPASVQAQCILTAKRLAQKHAHLSDRYKDLVENSNEKAVRLLSSSGLK